MVKAFEGPILCSRVKKREILGKRNLVRVESGAQSALEQGNEYSGNCFRSGFVMRFRVVNRFAIEFRLSDLVPEVLLAGRSLLLEQAADNFLGDA